MTTTQNLKPEDHARIKDLICDILEIEPADMTATSRFKEDHEVDSMGAIEILSQLERAFGIDIDQNELVRMANLESVVLVVEESVAAKHAPAN
ncbi:acyl carrier protein [Streptomyces sp. NPDC006645]|uniref:acyl carrier protein n=1 Tax=unclassified Streptomyces TaxID=2593676 RepID=UPI00339EFDAD